MAENLRDIAKRVFRRAGWDPTPTEDTVQDVYAFINDAVQQMSLDCPIMFFEDRVVIQTDPDVASVNDTDTITLVSEAAGAPFDGAVNPWVFQADIPVALNGNLVQLDHASWTTGSSAGDLVARQWAGRMIDIVLANGTIIRNQIRSVWLESVDDGGGNVYIFTRISVVTPWLEEVFGPGPFQFRVYTNDYFLQDDIIELKSVRIIGNDHTVPLAVIGQAEAETAGFANERSPEVGTPQLMFRGAHFQMPAPNVAPVCTPSARTWKGPEPAGEFEYVYTYCWGRRRDYNAGIALWSTRATEWGENTSTVELGYDEAAIIRKREPIWESSPSPVSASTTVQAPDVTLAPGVNVIFPNIEYHLGFMLSGKTSEGARGTAYRRLNVAHSGWHIRVYRRRKSADFTNYTTMGDTLGSTSVGSSAQSVTSLIAMDIHDAFYLLAEVRLDEFNYGAFIDDGTILPDMLRRLRTSNGYQGVRFWPRPDSEYEIELRCIRRPQALVSASDAPPIHAEGVQLIVDYAASKLYEKMNEPGMAMARMADYQRNLATLTRRYGDLRPNNTPIPKRFARAWGYNRGGPWRRPRGSE